MTETDIYTNKQRLPQGKKKPSRRRRRSERRFDESNRRRRSKNSGMRRLMHLFRKSENEKAVWCTFLVTMVLLLALIGVWQFWYVPTMAKKDALMMESAADVESAAE